MGRPRASAVAQDLVQVRDLGGEQTREVVHDVARDAERGTMGDQREASGEHGRDLVLVPVPPVVLRLSSAGPVRPACSRMEWFMPLRVGHFAEKTHWSAVYQGAAGNWVPLLRVHLGCRVSGKTS